MIPPASTDAGDVYEIITHAGAEPTSWWRETFLKLTRMGPQVQGPGALVLSVRERRTGTEVFRHVEEAGHDEDDEDHILPVIERDLAVMTAEEFKTRWVD